MSTPWHHKEIDGEGESFIWLHGWGQDHTSLNRIASLLGDIGSHRLYDQPGFGDTDKLSDGAGTEAYADALKEELERSSALGPHILIGHSFGGRVSVQMAARHPGLVKAVILISGAGIPKPKSLTGKLRFFYLKVLGKLSFYSDKLVGTTFIDGFRAKYGSRDYKAAGALRKTFITVVGEDLTEEASAILVPVLLIYGSEDLETPPIIGEKYAKAIKGSHLETLEGFGHLDILSRGAYQCEALMRDFLENIK